MDSPPRTAPAAALLAAVLLLSGCSGSSDGATDGSSDGSTTGTGSGSASGLTGSELAGPGTTDPLVLEAVDRYRSYVLGQVDALLPATEQLTDAVRAGDLAAAKAAYAPSRVPWERIEPVAGLVEEIDGKVDARVDDVAGVDDPGFTGWHKLEHGLFERGTTTGLAPVADQLDADLVTLSTQLRGLAFPPRLVALGPGELVEEVSKGKITGEEDRYAHTDLWDFAANIEGSEQAVALLEPALRQRDAALLGEIERGFADVRSTLSTYAVGTGPDGGLGGGGYRPYGELTEADRTELQAALGGLAESLSRMPAVLGLT